MSTVLHIGASDGELDFYSKSGVQKLVYAEPDKVSLQSLLINIKKFNNQGQQLDVSVIPKACSARSGENLLFYANGSGQSSLEKPQSRVFNWVGDHFEQYLVETISLSDLKDYAFGGETVDYLCIDTQGHEKAILCGVDPQYLRSNFKVIDVELMSDVSQYSVSQNAWKEVVTHLIRSGFQPIIHPHGITESYIFVNSLLDSRYFTSCITAIRDRLMKNFFAQHGMNVGLDEVSVYSSLGDCMFLPFTHIGGAIHASLLQPFREEFVSNYLNGLVPVMGV